MKTSLLKLAFHSDLLAVRFFLALGAVFVGVGLLCPPDLVFPPRAHTESVRIAVLIPQWGWGLLFMLQGGVMVWSLLWSCRNKLLLWLDAVLGCALWTCVTLACFLIFWPGWAIFLLSTLCASFWVLVRYSTDDETERRCRRSQT